jgi:DNA-binding MarR family transcriptional regulator
MTKRAKPRPPPGRHHAPLHVLVAAVTAAERGEPMRSTHDLADEIGCVAHGIAMAVLRLERAGVVRRIQKNGRRRLLIVRTGAATAEVEE